MANELNQNNFLRWTGEFIDSPFEIEAVNDTGSGFVNSESIIITPLVNDSATVGIDPTSFEITLQDNEDNPATWNPETEELTYYPPVGVAPGDRALKYRFSDLNGNPSNEATIVVTIAARATAWRGYGPSYGCQLEGGEYTGDGLYTQLEKYYTDNDEKVIPAEYKDNDDSDPDYVPPSPDVNCNDDIFNVWNLAAASEGVTACDSVSLADYYTAKSVTILTYGVTLYTDSALTTPVPNNDYSNGVKAFTTSTGVIVNVKQCIVIIS